VPLALPPLSSLLLLYQLKHSLSLSLPPTVQQRAATHSATGAPSRSVNTATLAASVSIPALGDSG
jgi:hypothetical protein